MTGPVFVLCMGTERLGGRYDELFGVYVSGNGFAHKTSRHCEEERRGNLPLFNLRNLYHNP